METPNQTESTRAAMLQAALANEGATVGKDSSPAAEIRTSREIVLQNLEVDMESPVTSAFWREKRRFERKDGSTRLSLPSEVGVKPEFTNINLAVMHINSQTNDGTSQIIKKADITLGEGCDATAYAEYNKQLPDEFTVVGMSPSVQEWEKLKDLQSRMEKIAEAANYHSLANVSKHVFEKRDAVHTATAAGQDISGMRIPQRQEVAADYLAKQQGYIAVLVKMTNGEVLPLCKPILERFEAACEQEMKDTEVGDRWLCESWGLAYTPSIIWRAMAHIACRFSIEAKFPKIPGQWRTPKQILEGIVSL